MKSFIYDKTLMKILILISFSELDVGLLFLFLYEVQLIWARVASLAEKWQDSSQGGVTPSSEIAGGGGGKARFNVATPTYEARTRPLHVQHTYTV